ncbi:MAG: peptide deformylase [Spirochaetales bacterium]|nr:peptide deformylase [Spirochaetales bacterium]
MMANILHQENHGAALAAPQVGLNKRIVVIDYMNEYRELINPQILESEGSQLDDEGCLSLPGLWGKVWRAKTVTITYKDRNGHEFIITRENEMARCLQHEIDHLNGILFIDHLQEGDLEDSSGRKIHVKKIQELSRNS